MVWANGLPRGAGTTYPGKHTFDPGCYVIVNGLRYVCPYVRWQRLDLRKPKYLDRPLIDVLCEMFDPPPWCRGIAKLSANDRSSNINRSRWEAHFQQGRVLVSENVVLLHLVQTPTLATHFGRFGGTSDPSTTR